MTVEVSPARRAVVVAALAGSAGVAGCDATPTRPFATLAQARQAVQALAAGGTRTTGAWRLPAVLVHLAQSIEYSIAGFPELRPVLFRATLGKAAFAVFDARGAMSHPLDQPIPGAPALEPAPTLAAAVARLLSAIDAFEAATGALKPHFAYGELSKTAYARAHLMHIGEHWSQFATAA